MKIICGFVVFTLLSSPLVLGLPQFLDEPDQSVTLVVEPDAYKNPQLIDIPERPTTQPKCLPWQRYDGSMQNPPVWEMRMENVRMNIKLSCVVTTKSKFFKHTRRIID
ncbi:hypothetical protein J6590_106618 [Homalodisca vitripennis]|nr:hypothetical protein J6590_106618 [Homalodisca vitripennis]